MIGKKDAFWGDSEKQWALELTWRQMADCSKGGIRPPETNDHRQWTDEYVGSLAAWTTTADGGGWHQRPAGCGRKDTVAPDMHAGIGRRAQPAWSRCVPETAANEGLAASVWRARIEKIDESLADFKLVFIMQNNVKGAILFTRM